MSVDPDCRTCCGTGTYSPDGTEQTWRPCPCEHISREYVAADPMHAATDRVLLAESDRIGFGLEDFRSAARAWFEQLSKELDDAGDLYQDSSLWRWAGWVREVGTALVPHLDAVHTEHPGG